ncbi:MAG: aspartate ammonia-lyase [Selenomonadaceae bacterium]|nr:aspartate ammonia-lyase [Selenomonadaceae bacterium]
MFKETDCLGELEVREDVYYGIQTERARNNFAISGATCDDLPEFIRAIAEVKKSAALANKNIGALDEKICNAICAAADEIISGKMAGNFPVDVFQGGGSTSTNMNVNEVIAKRANEILTGHKGYDAVHPNTHVNRGQSTNDVIPTAIEITCYRYAVDLKKSLEHLTAAIARKAEEFKTVVKTSRTCLQDAVPITLGQEFGGYESFLRRHINLLDELFFNKPLELTLGGTATGTGLSTFDGYMSEVFIQLEHVTGISVKQRENLFDGFQNGDDYIRISAYLKSLATGLGKIATDLRMMSSGPRCGLQEVFLPAVQPGSSIMPGKVNPVMPELINQVCYQVCGDDFAITMAVEGGELDLNVWEPVIIKNLTEQFKILTGGMIKFADLCIDGIQANVEKLRADAEATMANATVASAILGYVKGTEIAHKAVAEGKTVKQVIREMKLFPDEEIDKLFDTLMMTDWKLSQKVLSNEKL